MLSENEFNKFVEEIRFDWAQRHFTDALAKIESVMDRLTPQMKARCLLLRGEMKDEQGLPDDAREDWLTAIDYSIEGSYLRYLLEYEIGNSFQRAALLDKALLRYHKALESCANGDFFSGSSAAAAFLALNGGQIPVKYRSMIATVVEKSWAVLELPGNPQLRDLPQAIVSLIAGRDEKIRKIKETANSLD